jgi:hypothetical protein
MGALMSSKIVETAEQAETHQESLTERMARSPLSLAEILRYATEIAAALRGLHQSGLEYGAVSAQLILLGPAGAALRPTGALHCLGDGRSDVKAFGAVLADMLRREKPGSASLDGIRQRARALSQRCLKESPDMQRVLIALRLMALMARQGGAKVRKAPRKAPQAGTVRHSSPVQQKPLLPPPFPRRVPGAAAPVKRSGRSTPFLTRALHWTGLF